VKKKLATPTIHLNGSNGANLENDYMQAYQAATELLAALQNIDLHGRDYYVQSDPDAFERAREQSSARYVAVMNVRKELEQIILAIQEQS
jgi:hypothetical protein